MQGVKFGGNHPNLEDMLYMKRQLSIIVDENHLLKVKIRRLENEMIKKNKYIDYLHLNAQKRQESRRMTYESASNTIFNLKRENEELRDKLTRKDRADQKRNIHMKTMLLYKQIDTKSTRKPLQKSSRVLKSQTSFDNCPRRLGSLSDSNTQPRNYPKAPFAEPDAEEFLDMITDLKQQQIVDRSIIETKNSEIAQLTADLEEMKANISSREFNPMPVIYQDSLASGDGENFATRRKQLSTSFERPQKIYRDFEVNITTEHKKTTLEPVEELSEEEICTIQNSEMNLDSPEVPRRTKTLIEYEIDSEVSSDGENIYFTNNIGKYCKTTGTMSTNNDNISD